MATSEALFKWNNGKLTNLIKCLQKFESSMKFRNCESTANKVKSYEIVAKILAEVYEVEPDAFGPGLVSEILYKKFR